jgi:hypothetical protein
LNVEITLIGQMDEEEIEVLSSIYGEELKKIQNNKFEIKITVDELLDPISFIFWYKNKIPEFMIECSWLSGEDISKISSKLEKSTTEKTQIIFNYIEWIRDNVKEEIDFSSLLQSKSTQETKELEKKEMKLITHGESFTMKKSKISIKFKRRQIYRSSCKIGEFTRCAHYFESIKAG